MISPQSMEKDGLSTLYLFGDNNWSQFKVLFDGLWIPFSIANLWSAYELPKYGQLSLLGALSWGLAASGTGVLSLPSIWLVRFHFTLMVLFLQKWFTDIKYQVKLFLTNVIFRDGFCIRPSTHPLLILIKAHCNGTYLLHSSINQQQDSYCLSITRFGKWTSIRMCIRS